MATTGSTNSDLVAEARAGSTGRAVLVADHQTEGRGRRDRTWTDTGGALMVSFRVPVSHAGPGALWCLAAATLEVLDRRCSEPVGAKWPNDLVVESGPAPGKLAGLLAELVTGPVTVAVAGVGVNLAPVEGVPGATSLLECGGTGNRDEILVQIISELTDRLDDPAAAVAELRDASVTVGRRVRVDLGVETVTGTASGIDDEGRLLLTTDGTTRALAAGDVVHLR